MLIIGDIMKKFKSKKSLEEFWNIAKWDIVLYVILTILFSIIGLVGLILENSLIPLTFFLAIYVFIGIFWKVNTFYNIKKIISYIDENNLRDKIGDIDYYNENNLFLTEKYMIVNYRNKVYIFEYKDILKIFYEDKLHIGKNSGHSRFLHIVVNGHDEFVFLIQSTSITYQETKDISDYLLDKNSKIILEKAID